MHVCLPIYLSTYPPIYLSIYLSVMQDLHHRAIELRTWSVDPGSDGEFTNQESSGTIRNQLHTDLRIRAVIISKWAGCRLDPAVGAAERSVSSPSLWGSSQLGQGAAS